MDQRRFPEGIGRGKGASEDRTRRSFMKSLARGAVALAIGGTEARLLAGREPGKEGAREDVASPLETPRLVWQIDPLKCIQCGNCAKKCVLDVSAVKCVHDFTMCGYCELCLGFFRSQPNALTSAAENQACPTGAIYRRFIEDPYFEYVIDEAKCIGCGKCVKGCTAFGNGSLYLQVRHDRCLNCNECSIAASCPAGAFIRVPADKPYIVKHEWMDRR